MTDFLTVAAGVAVGIVLATIVLPLLLIVSLYIFVETTERVMDWWHRNKIRVIESDPVTGQTDVCLVSDDESASVGDDQ